MAIGLDTFCRYHSCLREFERILDLWPLGDMLLPLAVANLALNSISVLTVPFERSRGDPCERPVSEGDQQRGESCIRPYSAFHLHIAHACSFFDFAAGATTLRTNGDCGDS